MEKFISGKNEFPSASIWKVILSFDWNAMPFLVLEIIRWTSHLLKIGDTQTRNNF